MPLPTPSIILLAAGASRRYGGIKLLAPVGDMPLLRHSVAAALSASPDVTVVTGAHAAMLRPVLHDLPVRLLHHRGWPDGIGSSIAAAFADLLRRSAPPDLALVGLADQPGIGVRQWQAMIERAAGEPGCIVAARHDADGLLGPPCAFPREDFAALAALRGDGGAKPILRSNPDRVCIVDMPEAALDIDQRSDLSRSDSSVPGGAR